MNAGGDACGLHVGRAAVSQTRRAYCGQRLQMRMGDAHYVRRLRSRRISAISRGMTFAA
jgi:hypothetical protein